MFISLITVSVLYIVFKVNLIQDMALVFNPVYIGVGNSNFNVEKNCLRPRLSK